MRAATRTIAGFVARRVSTTVGADRLTLWEVDDLERHVDRDALLRDDAPAPPYWAHCWSGARVLAERVPRDAGRVLEIGCGLGLPGLTAARRGARVVFADRVATPLAFVARDAAVTNCLDAGLVVADSARLAWRPRSTSCSPPRSSTTARLSRDGEGARRLLAPDGRVCSPTAIASTPPLLRSRHAAGLDSGARRHPRRRRGRRSDRKPDHHATHLSPGRTGIPATMPAWSAG
jgi:hypothetical protein